MGVASLIVRLGWGGIGDRDRKRGDRHISSRGRSDQTQNFDVELFVAHLDVVAVDVTSDIDGDGLNLVTGTGGESLCATRRYVVALVLALAGGSVSRPAGLIQNRHPRSSS